MSISTHSTKNDLKILALGAESAGNFSVFSKGHFFHSGDFGDLLEPKSFARFQKSVLAFLKKEKIKPDVIINDLHPLYVTSVWGKELAKKLKSEYVEVQHHIAHIFSQIFNFQFSIFNEFSISNFQFPDCFYGIALDGTGYGLDGKIWGGEIFAVKSRKSKVKSIERIGHLENQLMLGGEIAVREPARMLISILSKFLGKKEVYVHVKKYYSKNQFELLWNQLQQNFNCLETSSAGRILDATSVLLGFSKNERKEKHGATYLLEKNSTKPYTDLQPKIKNNILLTTPLFEYLVKNISKDKKRLAATAQLYIAEGLYEIICHSGLPVRLWRKPESSHKTSILDSRFHGNDIILSGGISNNKIISEYFENKKTGTSSKIPVVQVPRGDAGLSVGQIIYYLM